MSTICSVKKPKSHSSSISPASVALMYIKPDLTQANVTGKRGLYDTSRFSWFTIFTAFSHNNPLNQGLTQATYSHRQERFFSLLCTKTYFMNTSSCNTKPRLTQASRTGKWGFVMHKSTFTHTFAKKNLYRNTLYSNSASGSAYNTWYLYNFPVLKPQWSVASCQSPMVTNQWYEVHHGHTYILIVPSLWPTLYL